MENKKLEEFQNYLHGRKVAIIGLGVSNEPLIDYLYNLGAHVMVFDKREPSAISPDFSGVTRPKFP